MRESTTSRRVALALAGVGGVLSAVQHRARRKLRKRRASLRTERTLGDSFDSDSIADLPPAARRYLRHAIEPDTPLARRVELTMDGQLHLGDRWLSFDAEETLAARRGFVWRPRVRFGVGLWFSGADFHVDGTGGQRFALAGLVPIVRSSGTSHRPLVGRSISRRVGLAPHESPSGDGSRVGGNRRPTCAQSRYRPSRNR